jgi:HAD superfamily hydrolase (TIGR01509 family)
MLKSKTKTDPYVTNDFGLVFDMDGVIVHNNDWHLKSWLQFAKKLGMDLTEADFPEKIFGKTNEQILEKAFPQAGLAQWEIWSLEKEALYREMFAPHFELAPGLLPFLEKLKAIQIPLAVASNAPLVNVDFAVNLGKIRSFFQVILYAGLVAKPKPAPDIYLKACELLGKNPKDCFVIEDSPTGLEAARLAGCQTIAITSTYPKSTLKPLANNVFDRFEEIQNFLLNASDHRK